MKAEPWYRIAAGRSIVVRSLKVSAIVGTILNLINQFDAVIGDVRFDLLQAALTFLVPYCVATYGAVTATQAMQRLGDLDR